MEASDLDESVIVLIKNSVLNFWNKVKTYESKIKTEPYLIACFLDPRIATNQRATPQVLELLKRQLEKDRYKSIFPENSQKLKNEDFGEKELWKNFAPKNISSRLSD